MYIYINISMYIYIFHTTVTESMVSQQYIAQTLYRHITILNTQ